MADLIDRKALIAKCGEWYIEEGPENGFIGTLKTLLDMAPAVDAEPVKRGRWTTHRTMQHDGEWYCDQCDYEPCVFENTPYCPNCGAKMEVGE